MKFYREFYNVAFEEAIKDCGDILAEQARKERKMQRQETRLVNLLQIVKGFGLQS